MIKTYIFTVVFFVVCIALAGSSCSNSDAEEQIRLDIKTAFDDKGKLAGLKRALIDEIKNSLWGEPVEFGEDYSLWLTSPVIKSDSLTSITVELRKKSGIRKGKLLENTTLTFTEANHLDSNRIEMGKLIEATARHIVTSQKRKATSDKK
jgi:hypothetical protein